MIRPVNDLRSGGEKLRISRPKPAGACARRAAHCLPRVGGRKEGAETEGHLGLKAASRWGENQTHLAPTLAEKRSAPEGAPGQRSYRRRGAISFVAFSLRCIKRSRPFWEGWVEQVVCVHRPVAPLLRPSTARLGMTLVARLQTARLEPAAACALLLSSSAMQRGDAENLGAARGARSEIASARRW